MLDVDRALLDAGTTGGARPQHVRVDHGANQGPELDLLTVVGLLGEEAVGLGEHVVTEPHDEELRAEGLLGVPRRADRLAATALGAGGEVEHLLPSEVLDLAHTEDGVLGDVLHVHVRGLVEATEGTGTTGHADVDRGQEDVEVLGVGNEDQEPGDDRHVGQQQDGLERRVGRCSERTHDNGQALGGKRPVGGGSLEFGNGV